MNEQYNRFYESIRPDDALIEKTLHEAGEVKSRPVLKYSVTAAACAALALGSVPVLAANVPAFYDVLHRIAPETAERFRPVQTACESQGIRMEVGAIFLEEEQAKVYVTLQDLEGDRLNMDVTPAMTTYFFEVEGMGGMGWSGADVVEYDASTGTMTLLLELDMTEAFLHPGDEVTFHLCELHGDLEEFDAEVPGIALAELPLDSTLFPEGTLTSSGYGASGSLAAVQIPEEDIRLLSPTMEMALPFDGTSLTAAGYVDGKLRLQLCCGNPEMLTGGNLYLLDARGSRIDSELNFYGADDGKCYQDFLFDVPEEALGSYRLGAALGRYNTNLSGDWRVTFTIPEDAPAAE